MSVLPSNSTFDDLIRDFLGHNQLVITGNPVINSNANTISFSILENNFYQQGVFIPGHSNAYWNVEYLSIRPAVAVTQIIGSTSQLGITQNYNATSCGPFSSNGTTYDILGGKQSFYQAKSVAELQGLESFLWYFTAANFDSLDGLLDIFKICDVTLSVNISS
jgi:hypothetical protein